MSVQRISLRAFKTACSHEPPQRSIWRHVLQARPIHEDEDDALVLIVLFLDTLKRTEYKLLLRAVLHDRASRGISIALSALAGRKLMGFSYFRKCHGHTLNINETCF